MLYKCKLIYTLNFMRQALSSFPQQTPTLKNREVSNCPLQGLVTAVNSLNSPPLIPVSKSREIFFFFKSSNKAVLGKTLLLKSDFLLRSPFISSPYFSLFVNVWTREFSSFLPVLNLTSYSTTTQCQFKGVLKT